jgi:CelD/BcsL family acetyltransferase involved in cellulose biosynthesis
VVTGEILRGGPEIVEALTDEWRRLCDGPGSELPFSRPEWVDAYFRSNTGAWVIFAVRHAGTLVALLPMLEKKVSLSRLPATVLQAPSDFHLWPFDVPVAGSVDKTAAAEALWTLVRQSPDWDVVELPNVPRGGFAERLRDFAPKDGFLSHSWEYMQSPFVPLEKRSEATDPLGLTRSSNLRKQLKLAFRRIEREGGMRVLVDHKPRREVLERFLELEHLSWKGRAGSSIATREKDVEFLKRVTRAGADGGYLHLCWLEHRSLIVAVSIGFSYKGEYHAFKMAWDENLRRLSLGHVLVNAVLRDCAERGLQAVRMGGLRSAWKDQWTDQWTSHATHYLFRNSMYGRIAKRAQLWRIRDLIASLPPHRGSIEGASESEPYSPLDRKMARGLFATAGLLLRSFRGGSGSCTSPPAPPNSTT